MKALIISILVSIISFTSCEENKPTKVFEIEEKEEYKTQTDINIGSYEFYLSPGSIGNQIIYHNNYCLSYNEEAEQACQLICKNAATPYPADGIIYVSDINDAYRIKTGKSIKRFNI